MNHDLKNVLDQDENILWQDRPTFLPFIASGVPFLCLGIVWASIDFVIVQQVAKSPEGIEIGVLFFLLLHLMPFWLSIGNFIRLFLVFNNTSYAITNKRIIMRTGFLGIDFKSVDFDKIIDLRVDINPFENMFGVGSIKVNTGMTGSKGTPAHDSISAIKNPYDVFKKIKTVSVNVKTDWNYPNKFRPSENPGYKTEYKPE